VLGDPKSQILPRRLRALRKEKLFDNLVFKFGAVSDTKQSVLNDIAELIRLEGGTLIEGKSASQIAAECIYVIDSESQVKKTHSTRSSREKHVTSTWVFDCISHLKLLEVQRK
jgi:hypothetical protein